MNIVRIQLVKPNSFWFLNDLHLGPGNSLSEPFDLDTASPNVRAKINKASEELRVIKLVIQPEGTKPTLDINKNSAPRYELPRHRFNNPNINIARDLEEPQPAIPELPCLDDKEPEMPELKSFTVEVEPEPEIEETNPSDQDFIDARILLSKNGNTIKKVIRNMEKSSSEMKAFLLACIEVEKQGKKREGTIKFLEEFFLGVA